MHLFQIFSDFYKILCTYYVPLHAIQIKFLRWIINKYACFYIAHHSNLISSLYGTYTVDWYNMYLYECPNHSFVRSTSSYNHWFSIKAKLDWCAIFGPLYFGWETWIVTGFACSLIIDLFLFQSFSPFHFSTFAQGVYFYF